MVFATARLLCLSAIVSFTLACPDSGSRPMVCNGGTSQSKLSVMTYNLHLFDVASAVTRVPFLKVFLQDLVDTYLTSTDSKLADFRDQERIVHISDRILALTDKPDLIVLTELWSGDLSRELEDRLRGEYPFQYHPDADHYIFDGKVFGNGLALFSKYPIIPGTQRFTPFEKLAGFDDFTVKGIGQVGVQVCGGPVATIFFSHTQAVYSDPANSDQVTLDNVKQMAAIVNRYHDIHPGEAIIIAGDLNISETGPHYANMVQILAATDAFRFFHADANQYPGFTYDAKVNGLIHLFTEVDQNSQERERLDYIFYKPGGAITGVSNAIDGNPEYPPLEDSIKTTFDFMDPVSSTRLPLSDHYPVRVDFSLATS